MKMKTTTTTPTAPDVVDDVPPMYIEGDDGEWQDDIDTEKIRKEEFEDIQMMLIHFLNMECSHPHALPDIHADFQYKNLRILVEKKHKKTTFEMIKQYGSGLGGFVAAHSIKLLSVIALWSFKR